MFDRAFWRIREVGIGCGGFSLNASGLGMAGEWCGANPIRLQVRRWRRVSPVSPGRRLQRSLFAPTGAIGCRGEPNRFGGEGEGKFLQISLQIAPG